MANLWRGTSNLFPLILSVHYYKYIIFVFVLISHNAFVTIIVPFHFLSLSRFIAVVDEPEFTDVIENVTVPAGRNVRLACSVKNLRSFKVSSVEIDANAQTKVLNDAQ